MVTLLALGEKKKLYLKYSRQKLLFPITSLLFLLCANPIERVKHKDLPIENNNNNNNNNNNKTYFK